MKITLGPIPFYWPKEKIEAFYDAVRNWPVDRVCLGETVCPKRRQLTSKDWFRMGHALQDAGKEVVISTLALIEAQSELSALKRLCTDSEFVIEANDIGAVEILAELGRTFVTGPQLNIYNSQSLALLIKDGLTDWVLPVELGRDQLQQILEAIAAANLGVNTELFAHGYLPLALSARCFTARALDRPKDTCKQACLSYEEGILVSSQEDQRLFRLNGIQTLSGDTQDLLAHIEVIRQLPLNSIRLSPSCFDMAPIVDAYATALSGHPITAPLPWLSNSCNGYWLGTAGIDRS